MMKRIAIFQVIALVIVLGACSRSEEPIKITDVSGNIEMNAAWSGQVNVLAPVQILGGATLTIAPGTRVLFAAETYLDVLETGKIIAKGTASERIEFGAAVEGEPWWGIYLDDNCKGNEFAYCGLRAVSGGYSYALGFDEGATAAISYCTFDGNSGGGINAGDAGAGTAILNCSFGDNGDSADGPYDYVYNSLTCAESGNTANSVYDYNEIIVSEDVASDVVWSGQVYVDGEIEIVSGAMVVIKPGTYVMFASGSRLDVWGGARILAAGTANRRIAFRAANNGDFWEGIYLDDDSAGNEFSYCDFSDSGMEATYALGFDDGATAQIAYCVFDGNNCGGVDAYDADDGTSITYCEFGDNGDGPEGPYDLRYRSETCAVSNNTGSTLFDDPL